MLFSILSLLAVVLPQSSSFAPYSRPPVISNPQSYHNHNHRDANTIFSAAVDTTENDNSIESNDVTNTNNANSARIAASSAAAATATASSTSESSSTLPILFPSLATSLSKLGYSKPTPIQSASAKRALALENLLLIAPTGSGKTLSYMLPALEKVIVNQQHQQQQQQQQNDDESNGRRTVLVVAPTRELGLQLMRDTTSILSNLSDNDNNDNDNNDHSVLLAIQGVEMPTSQALNSATVLIGTPNELLSVFSKEASSIDFLAGNVLSTIILDEVDFLLPNSPKVAGGGGGGGGNNKEKGGNKKKGKVTPREERRRLVQKRKLLNAQRTGVELTSDSKVVGPTESLLKLIAGRRSSIATASSSGATSSAAYPYQILAGSATASRKTLDRLNKALRDAAMDVSSTVDGVWNGSVQPCRPEEESAVGAEDDKDAGSIAAAAAAAVGEDHTIRTVTVPIQVKHQYIRLEKDKATKPGVVLTAVAKAARVLKPKRALLFLCGEFGKSTAASSSSTTTTTTTTSSATKSAQPQSRERRGRQKTLKQKKDEATAASRARQPARGLSASMACFGLAKLGIEAKPLHVALGLDNEEPAKNGGVSEEGSGSGGDEDDESGDESTSDLPPFLVTFEGAATGLHLDDVDTVFVVGRPSSAASYLHLFLARRIVVRMSKDHRLLHWRKRGDLAADRILRHPSQWRSR